KAAGGLSFRFGSEVGSGGAADQAPAVELLPGQTRKEVEGGFVRRGKGVVEFLPIKLGISGDKYFEVTDGLKVGEEVVTGPYNAVRTLADGDEVRIETPAQQGFTSR